MADGHRLEFLDHAVLQLLKATGRQQLMQAVWVYGRPVDHDGVRRLHRNLSGSILNRLIEASPLPFGRPRWVRPTTPPPLLVADPRPRAELLDWADSMRNLPIDPERGPAWHLMLQPFTDGTSAVSVIGSHCIGDGVGALLAIHQAVTGGANDVTYDAAGTRSRGEGIVADLRQAKADLRRSARAAVAVTRTVYGAVRERRSAHAEVDTRTFIDLPTAAILVPMAEWDARAADLSGNSHTLFAAIVARLAASLGRRRRSDGAVSLHLAVNRRVSLDDDRAIAMEFARAAIEPDGLPRDLAQARSTLRESRRMLDHQSDPALELLPLVPWLPLRAMRKAPDLLFSYADDLPVSCSNLGDLFPDLARADGTPADHMLLRGVDSHVTLADLHRSHGHLVAVSGRLGDAVSISVESWEIGADNSRQRLRGLLDAALADFRLSGTHL